MRRLDLLAGLVLSCAGLSCNGGASEGGGVPGGTGDGLITGRVLDEEGNPVADAEVTLTLHAYADPNRSQELEPVTSDAEGRFRFPAASGYAVVEASSEDAESWYAASFLVEADAPPEELVVLVARPRRLAGRVFGFDGGGRPCWLHLEPSQLDESLGLPAGSQDLLEPARKLVQHNTDADGRFALDLPPGAWELTVMLEGVPAETRSVTPGGPPVDIRLGGPEQVHGVVRGADGNPLAEAMVSVTRPAEPGDWRWETVQTNARGEYLFGAYPYWSNPHLVVTAPGHAVWARALDASGAASSRYDVELEAGRSIRGRIFDESGAPVPDCLVTVHGPRRLELDHTPYHLPTTWEWHAGVAWDRTDDHGEFVIDRLYPCRFEVLAHPDGPPQIAAMARAESGGSEVRLRLGQGLDLRPRLRGVLRRGDFDLPVAGASVTLEQRFAGGSRTEWIADLDPETGRFDLTGLDSAPSTLTVEAPQYATARWEWPKGELPRAPLALRLHRLQDLSLAVRDASGETVRYPRVTARDASGAHYRARALPIPGMGGVSVVHGLPATRCVLTVAHPTDSGTGPGDAAFGVAELEVDLRLPQAGTLEVVLPRRSGELEAAQG